VLKLSSGNDMKFAYKLTSAHLDIVGPQRQKVRPAVQLFSKSVSMAIVHYGNKNKIQTPNWKEVINKNVLTLLIVIVVC